MKECNNPNCSFDCPNCPYGRDYEHFKLLVKKTYIDNPIKHKKSKSKSLFFHLFLF